MEAYCGGHDLEDLGIDPRLVRTMWSAFKTGHTHRTDLLWQMFTLVAWSRESRTARVPAVAASLP